LQQHLGDGGGAAKITVDLEGRAVIEKIRAGELGEQVAQDL
jgi:hypothetical protein